MIQRSDIPFRLELSQFGFYEFAKHLKEERLNNFTLELLHIEDLTDSLSKLKDGCVKTVRRSFKI